MPQDTRDQDQEALARSREAGALAEPGLSGAGRCAVQGVSDDEAPHPRGCEHAGEVYHPDDPKVDVRYPEGVRFDGDGYPDFSPYARAEVQIDMKGNYTTDLDDANAAAGLAEKPKGWTWHHHQDGTTMQLVPTDLHGAVPHSGGASIKRHEREEQE